ncbi:unnamed protein product, partial [Sphacelaria rigidula]
VSIEPLQRPQRMFDDNDGGGSGGDGGDGCSDIGDKKPAASVAGSHSPFLASTAAPASSLSEVEITSIGGPDVVGGMLSLPRESAPPGGQQFLATEGGRLVASQVTPLSGEKENLAGRRGGKHTS